MRKLKLLVCSAFFGIQSTIVVGGQSLNDGWILKQKHMVNGEQTIYISHDALRIDNKEAGLSYVASAITGDVTVLNLKRKVRYTMAMKNFRNRMMQVISGYSNDDLRALAWAPSKKKAESDYGRAEWFNAHGVYTSHEVQHGFLESKPYQKRSLYQLLVSREIKISDCLIMLLAEIQGAPDLHGVPLKEITQYGREDIQRVMLETQELKRTHIDAEKWAIPQSFKTVSGVGDVVSGDGALLNEFLGK